LAQVAEDEGLPTLFPAGNLAALVGDLARGVIDPNQLLDRLPACADQISIRRVRDLMGPVSPRASPERELRRAMLKAKVGVVEAELNEVIQQVTRAGSPPPEDLMTTQLTLVNRRRDLEKRLRDLDTQRG